MFDIAFASNENDKQKFNDKAKKLGFEKVFFIEPFSREKAGADAVFINTNNKKDILKQIARAKNRYKLIIVLGIDNEISRFVVEKGQINVLLSPEYGRTHDFMHYRNSGLNQVICKLATDNKIAMGINFSEIFEMKDNKEKALRIGRIMQNIELCSKYRTKMLMASFAKTPEQMVSASDMINFAMAIGMTPGQAKESLQTVERI